MKNKLFWSKVSKSKGCWNWTASLMEGYGAFGFRDKIWRAHRVAWVLTKGEIPIGMCVLHHCDNPRCVRPSHLFIGTRGDNIRDCVSKQRHWCQKITHCPKKHKYTKENTYKHPKGARYCRICLRAEWRRKYWKKKAA